MCDRTNFSGLCGNLLLWLRDEKDRHEGRSIFILQGIILLNKQGYNVKAIFTLKPVLILFAPSVHPKATPAEIMNIPNFRPIDGVNSAPNVYLSLSTSA